MMIINLAKKELKSISVLPMNWVILAMLIFALSTYFIYAFTQYYEVMAGNIQSNGRVGVTLFIGKSVFGLASLILLFAVPLFSMRLIAEERRSQTLTLLFSAPISLAEIVLGKFISLVAVLSMVIAVIGTMLCTLSNWTGLDYGYIFSNVLGLFLLVTSFSALGLYCSSLTAQPVIASFISFLALICFLSLDQFLVADASNLLNQILRQLSLLHHYEPLSQGIIDSTDVVYFILFTSMFLIFTIRRLNAERLRA